MKGRKITNGRGRKIGIGGRDADEEREGTED